MTAPSRQSRPNAQGTRSSEALGTPVQVSEADLDRLAAALAGALLAWWRRREETQAGGGSPSTAEEVRDDAAVT